MMKTIQNTGFPINNNIIIETEYMNTSVTVALLFHDDVRDCPIYLYEYAN